MTQKSNINLLSNHILSVQASLNGFSFCIIDTLENDILFFKEYTFNKQYNPIELEEALHKEFESNYLLQGEFKKVNLIHQNNICTFVPKALFNKNDAVNYLKFNNKIFESDFIAHDKLQNQEIITVYVPFVNLNNYFFERFNTFDYQHAHHVLVQKLIENATQLTTKMYVNINQTSFEIVFLKNGKLNFYNSFTYTTKEDFIYYLLFTIEQLELNLEIIELILLGNIDIENELYHICYEYIRNVSINTKTTQFTYRNIAHKQNDCNHFVLLSTFNN